MPNPVKLIESSENATRNGWLTLEERRDNLREEIKRAYDAYLRLQGMEAMVVQMIKERDTQPPPEAA